MVDAMFVIYRALLVLGLLILAAGACAVWNVYGAWPVPDGYEFPRHSMWGGGPTALFDGELVEVDGCVRTAGDDGYTVVWPPGYSLSLQDGQPIVHGIGRDARMGAPVRMGGGFYETVPPTGRDVGGCPPPFFLSTGFID